MTIAHNRSYSEYHILEMVFTRQKSRADANIESPPRTQPEINIREVGTPSRTVFTQEQNELFFNKFLNTTRIKRVKILIIMFLV